MECTGWLLDITRSWNNENLIVTFGINGNINPQDLADELLGKCLDIQAKKYRPKRSLDANGLLWHCLGEIAKALNTDKWDVYLMMLKRYGKYTYICIRPNMVDAMKKQWRECEVVGEIEIGREKAIQMLCYFGSSSYDSKEFSRLLDGVISEMKEMGLPVPTSKEMQRVLEEWERMKTK
jgi:hypothetical protein